MVCPRYLRNQVLLTSVPPSLRSLRRPQSPLSPPPPPPLEEYYQELNKGSSGCQLQEAMSLPHSSGYYSSPPHNSSGYCSSPPHIYDRPISPAKSSLSSGSGSSRSSPRAANPVNGGSHFNSRHKPLRTKQVHFAPACDQSPAPAKSFPSLRSPPVRRSLHADFQSQIHPSLRLSNILPLSTSTSSSTSGNSS